MSLKETKKSSVGETCPCCRADLQTVESVWQCPDCSSTFPIAGADIFSMTVSEARQEGDRIRQVVSSGNILIVGDETLARAASRKKYSVESALPEKLDETDLDKFEMIHLPFCEFSPSGWTRVLQKIAKEMSESGVVRILGYHVDSGVVQYNPAPLVPGFTKDSLIDLLHRSGFRNIVLDRRPFHRSARLLSGQKKGNTDSLLTRLYRVPAWLEARLDQGAVIGAFVRK